MPVESKDDFQNIVDSLTYFISDLKNSESKYHSFIQEFVSNIRGTTGETRIKSAQAYETILSECFLDNMSFDSLKTVSEILINNVGDVLLQEILKTFRRPILSASLENLNEFCNNVITEVETVVQDSHTLRSKIGTTNTNNLLKQIEDLKNVYESAAIDEKYKILRSSLQQLCTWFQEQEKQVENSSFSKIGKFITSAFQLLGYRIIADKEGMQIARANMSQISEELSGKKKIFAESLKSQKEVISSFVEKIKKEKKGIVKLQP